MNRKSHIVAKQIEGAELFIIVRGIAFAASESSDADELSTHLQWSNTLEQLRRNIAIGTKKSI
jgi:hypothetical protein